MGAPQKPDGELTSNAIRQRRFKAKLKAETEDLRGRNAQLVFESMQVADIIMKIESGTFAVSFFQSDKAHCRESYEDHTRVIVVGCTAITTESIRLPPNSKNFVLRPCG
ncbi:hypothetical protein L596_012069 [Steinernema carpocapsae]|uniref:Uncharacterized protein n=1 Tax=Steinernema carpocapsae TaxID=34508 RepID=A0A4U5NWA8_STECR|nr:hypothetical protein L596_012069 [Steinernema carpocapsae]